MVFDSHRAVCVSSIFDENANGDQTWEGGGQVWTRILMPGPPRRVEFGMAYDSLRPRVVLFGGTTNFMQGMSDTWEVGLYPDCDTTTGAGALDIFDFLCFQNEFAAGCS